MIPIKTKAALAFGCRPALVRTGKGAAAIEVDLLAIDVERADIAGIGLAGHLTKLGAGPFAGQLAASGQGVGGKLLLEMKQLDENTGFVTAGIVDVTVRSPNGTSATSVSDQYTYVVPGALPTVTVLDTTTGPTAGGTTLTITGTNFNNVTGVTFGNIPAAFFNVISDTSIVATSPAGSDCCWPGCSGW